MTSQAREKARVVEHRAEIKVLLEGVQWVEDQERIEVVIETEEVRKDIKLVIQALQPILVKVTRPTLKCASLRE